MCTKKVKLGRPEELDRTEAFLEVANFLEENDGEQMTISDLISKMEVILDGSEYSAYSRVHMCSKLKGHFGDRLVITHINGKSNVVTFRNTAAAGVHAHGSIDVDQAKTVGKAILNDMKGQCVMEYTFRRKNQAITMT